MKKDYIKTEKQNNIPINLFDYKYETPCGIYTSKQTCENHVDILLLLNSKYSHYVLIKYFNRFISTKTKRHGKKKMFFLTHVYQNVI